MRRGQGSFPTVESLRASLAQTFHSTVYLHPMAKKQAKPAAAAKPAVKAAKKAQQVEVKASKKKPVAKVSTCHDRITSARMVVFCRKLSAATRSRHKLVGLELYRASRLMSFVQRIAALAQPHGAHDRSSHPARRRRATMRTYRPQLLLQMAKRCAMPPLLARPTCMPPSPPPFGRPPPLSDGVRSSVCSF